MVSKEIFDLVSENHSEWLAWCFRLLPFIHLAIILSMLLYQMYENIRDGQNRKASLLNAIVDAMHALLFLGITFTISYGQIGILLMSLSGIWRIIFMGKIAKKMYNRRDQIITGICRLLILLFLVIIGVWAVF